jgi:hypothetical protein
VYGGLSNAAKLLGLKYRGRVYLKNSEYLPYGKAKKLVKSYNLKSETEWDGFRQLNKLPHNIPTNPRYVYKESGWISMGEWLGTDYVSPRLRKYRKVKDARKFVRSLGLKSGEEWKEFCNSGELPEDIPKTPSHSYKNKGWISWPDWLGANTSLKPRRKRS